MRGRIQQRKIVVSVMAGAIVALSSGIAAAVFAEGPAPVPHEKQLPPPPANIVVNPAPVIVSPPEPAPQASNPESTVGQTRPTPTIPVRYVNNPLSMSMVVNKKIQLRPSFIPFDLRQVNVARAANEPLRQEAAAALEKMFAAAAAGGVNLTLNSGFRSYQTQKILYDREVAARGKIAADEFNARPGHSEHQSGLAADVAQGKVASKVNAHAWIAAHAHEYGYIVRYPAGKQSVTGYRPEPWHIRYVGAGLAAALFASGKTMEEHFGLPGGGYAQ